MKILHCADLHLDSKMTAHLTPEKARERRREILDTFRRLVTFASESGAEAVIIAGDLFDRKTCSAAAANTVLALIRDNPDIQFFYLRGNHDMGPVFRGRESELRNLYLFSSDHWSTWSVGASDVRITGAELDGNSSAGLFQELKLEKDACNLVVLHGQAEDSFLRTSRSRGASAPIIPLRTLAGRGIDYLALGHIHRRQAGRLDGRGIWCYPGCPEGRGFDECGEHGCILLDIDPDTHRIDLSFVPLAGRLFREISADVSACRDSQEMLKAVSGKMQEERCRSRDLIKVLLTGEREITEEIPLEYLTAQLNRLFYFVKLEDQTRIMVDYRSFASDPSLKGEFVRRVRQEESLTEEEKAEIIQRGIRLLMGVEVYED